MWLKQALALSQPILVKHGLTVDVEADVYTIDGLVAKIKKFWMVTIDETQYFKTTPFAFK